MYFPSQPVTSMRQIGFEDNFFVGPTEAERSKRELGYKEMRELSLGLEATQEAIDSMNERWGNWRSEVKR
jgi:hypothetical protein